MMGSMSNWSTAAIKAYYEEISTVITEKGEDAAKQMSETF
jgi:hypothetical protein